MADFDPERARKMIADILDRAPMSVRDIAEQAGVSFTTLYAWQSGKRNPSPAKLQAVAAALEAHGGTLAELAAELRATTAEGGDNGTA